jgi:uncharacterized protein DUF1444
MSAMTREHFVQEILRIVPARFPLVKLAPGDEPFSMRVNGQMVGLENLYRLAVLSPEDMRQQIERWVVELLRANEGLPQGTGSFDEFRDRILPMVLSDQLSDTVHRETLTEPLVPGLRIAYAIDSDRSIAYIPRALVKQWHVTVDQLHDTAIENLVSRSEAMSAQVAQDESGRVDFIVFQTGDGYDASRILLPTLHERLREHIGSPFVAGIPNRDILLCFRNEPDTVERVRAQVVEDHKRMPHQVSDQLFLITADGIAPMA